MGLLATMLTGGRPGRKRILPWIKTLMLSLLRRPWHTIRCLHPFGFARESLILLCMQALDGELQMRLGRRWYFPFRRVLMTCGKKVPTFIPEANEFACKLSQQIGGTPMSMISEIFFDMPGTAHILGGCVMAASREEGVVDSRHGVFGYRNMYICDGSVVAGNLGVNPSLTITAMTERAMSYIEPASDADWN
jgi:cholesterol oxidase